MKVLSVSVSRNTLLALGHKGVVVEELEGADVDSIIHYSRDGLFDACIVDLDGSGFGVYLPREIRESEIQLPIIGLSAGDEEMTWSEYRATFLEQGGDDLSRLPGSPRELVASLRACSRRATGSQLDVIECVRGQTKLKVNLTALLVTINDRPIQLTGKEFLMLSILVRSGGRLVTKETFLSRMYVEGLEEVPEIRIIDVFICKLRQKLSAAGEGGGGFIETIWGQGYKLASHP